MDRGGTEAVLGEVRLTASVTVSPVPSMGLRCRFCTTPRCLRVESRLPEPLTCDSCADHVTDAIAIVQPRRRRTTDDGEGKREPWSAAELLAGASVEDAALFIDEMLGPVLEEGAPLWALPILRAYTTGTTKPNTDALANELGVHPKSIRNRVRKLVEELGDFDADPTVAMSLGVALTLYDLHRRGAGEEPNDGEGERSAPHPQAAPPTQQGLRPQEG